MIYQNNYYCINYNDSDKAYIAELIDTINTSLKRIMNFFEIKDFINKKTINIWHDLSEYQRYIKQYVNEYQEWMVADTFDKNINILSLNLFLTGQHQNSNLSDYCKIIVHEFVHACQQEVNPIANNVEWFWEALATNLSNQDFRLIDIKYSKEDIMLNYHSLSDAYSVSYTIGKYMLTHLSAAQILQYVKNPNKLKDDTDMILEKTRLHVRSDET